MKPTFTEPVAAITIFEEAARDNIASALPRRKSLREILGS
jgi:hypothetical protein